MDRRKFIMTGAVAMAAAGISSTKLFAADPQFGGKPVPGPVDDYKIVTNEVKDGVRYVTATPSMKVCTKQIKIEINTKDNTIRNCEFVRGCPGNAIGLCTLLKGMKVSDAIKKLGGINCGGRGTSCPDQLARILTDLKLK